MQAGALAVIVFGLTMVWINYDADAMRANFRRAKGKYTIWGAPAEYITATYVPCCAVPRDPAPPHSAPRPKVASSCTLGLALPCSAVHPVLAVPTRLQNLAVVCVDAVPNVRAPFQTCADLNASNGMCTHHHHHRTIAVAAGTRLGTARSASRCCSCPAGGALSR